MAIEGMVIKFQPKGGMCAVCADKNKCCDHLTFFDMPVIGNYREDDQSIMIVRCLGFKQLH